MLSGFLHSSIYPCREQILRSAYGGAPTSPSPKKTAPHIVIHSPLALLFKDCSSRRCRRALKTCHPTFSSSVCRPGLVKTQATIKMADDGLDACQLQTGQGSSTANTSTKQQEDRQQTATDGLDELLERFAKGEFPPGFLDNLPRMTAERVVHYDFGDSALIGKPGIHCEHLPDEDVAKLGRSVIPMVSSAFSRQGAAAIFLLAYQVKDPSGKYMLNGIEDISSDVDKRYDEYTDQPISAPPVPAGVIGAGNDDPKVEAALYGYIAMSLMRLFTKAPGNYVKAWNHIVARFEKFYGRTTAHIQLPTPNEASIQGLKSWMTMDSTARNTLYRFLYIGNSDTNCLGLKRFLYEMHLEYSGMHIASLFLDLCKILSCGHELLLKEIKEINTQREFESEATCLSRLVDLLSNTDDEHKRRMWKYGRIFDDTFMDNLQTKSCRKLVYIFAEALRSEDPRNYGGVLQIAELVDVSAENKKQWAAIAQRLLKAVRSSCDVGSSGSR